MDELGSSAVSPGGGSAAALTAAVGIALVEMVTAINDRRAGVKSAGHRAAKTLRQKTIRLIAEDAQAFAAISKCFKEGKKSARYQAALRKGAQVPMEICGASAQGARLGLKQAKRTRPWLAGDLAEAGVLLEAAFHSGRLNVEINLKALTDRRFVRHARSRMNRLAGEIRKARHDFKRR